MFANLSPAPRFPPLQTVTIMFNIRMLAIALIFVAAPATGASQRAPYSPARGSVERQMIIEAFRVPVSRAVRRTVIFNEVRLKVQNGWAFIWAVPRSPDGQQVLDLDDPDCVNCTDNVVGLLRWQGSRWIVLQYELAPGELPYNWERRYPGAPRAIFPWHWPQ
ncbi:MAG TPA: hypothetical protein VFJ16_00415 [Longimicrobium sp.]|nr:hypothetical protein [Longimicrobium sp.]